MSQETDPPPSAAVTPDQPSGAFLEAVALRINELRRAHPDVKEVGVDFLFVCYLNQVSRFGRFSYGPIGIDAGLVEEQWFQSYRRVGDGEQPGSHADSARRFYRLVAEEVARSGRRRVDEMHWLLAFMRTNEGLPARVFGELGVRPETVEQFARGEGAAAGAADPLAERLYSPEEVADYLGVHVQTVRTWIRSGRLPARRILGQRALRVRASDLTAVLEPIESDIERE